MVLTLAAQRTRGELGEHSLDDGRDDRGLSTSPTKAVKTA
jgi:hypothetical protein